LSFGDAPGHRLSALCHYDAIYDDRLNQGGTEKVVLLVMVAGERLVHPNGHKRTGLDRYRRRQSVVRDRGGWALVLLLRTLLGLAVVIGTRHWLAGILILRIGC